MASGSFAIAPGYLTFVSMPGTLGSLTLFLGAAAACLSCYRKAGAAVWLCCLVTASHLLGWGMPLPGRPMLSILLVYWCTNHRILAQLYIVTG